MTNKQPSNKQVIITFIVMLLGFGLLFLTMLAFQAHHAGLFLNG